MPNSASASVENIKKAALQAVAHTMPSGIYFGTVVSISPLKINIEQKMTLTAKQLILSTLVQDFKVNMKVNNGEVQEYTVYLGFSVGEKVMLIRVQGGQRFVVLDRLR